MSETWTYERIWELLEHGLRASGASADDRYSASAHIKQVLASGRVGREEARAIVNAAPAVFQELAKADGSSISAILSRFPMDIGAFGELLQTGKDGILAASGRVRMTDREYRGS